MSYRLYSKSTEIILYHNTKLLIRSLARPWNFSGLATMVRIVLMHYINLNTFFEKPDEKLKNMLMESAKSPPEEEK